MRVRILIAAGSLLALGILTLAGIVFYHLLLALVRGSKVEFCPHCRKHDVRPSWPAGIVDALLAGLHHFPYRCRACNYRYYRFRSKRPEAVH